MNDLSIYPYDKHFSFRSCPDNYTCVADVGPNPDHGFTSFDNIGWALLMAFQILTMDYWENLYNKVLRPCFHFHLDSFFGSKTNQTTQRTNFQKNYPSPMYSTIRRTKLHVLENCDCQNTEPNIKILNGNEKKG